MQISEIVRQIHSGNLFAAQAGAADIIGNAAAHMNSSEDLYGFCLLLFSWILLEEQRQTLSQEEIRIFLQLAESLSACHLTEALQAGVNQALDGFSAAVAQGFIPRRSQLVHEIKTYIRGHLEESPTIKEVAAQVFLAPTYVCTLFKEETGKTINAFMVEEKMAKAQILFRGGALRVYQVSKMLGYQDVKYFSRTFKRFTGLTPSAYIEKASERP